MAGMGKWMNAQVHCTPGRYRPDISRNQQKLSNRIGGNKKIMPSIWPGFSQWNYSCSSSNTVVGFAE